MKLLLVGDVCPTNQTAPLFDKIQTDTLFGDVRQLFQNKDFCFVNLECALTEKEEGIKKLGPNLKAPLNTAKVLKELGVNCCGMSNNHSFDYGIQGVADTKKALDEVGIDYTGFGENYEDSRKDYIIEKNGQKISLITVCEHEYTYALDDRMGARPYDPYDTMADIRKAKAVSDKVIVIYHGGHEHFRYPSPRVYKLCRAMVDNGADLVLGQHSHCIATYENYNSGHIFHGQGNFHFVRKSDEKGWHTSIATVYDTETNELEFIPLVSDGETSIHVAKGEEKEEILAMFAEINENLKNGKWREGWHEDCMGLYDYYQGAIKNAFQEDSTQFQNDLIGHFLDCEAHTDVWWEIFPTYNQTNEK